MPSIFSVKKEGKIMPNMDGTGPAGMGPLTGRGLGNCNAASRANTGRQGNFNNCGRQGQQSPRYRAAESGDVFVRQNPPA